MSEPKKVSNDQVYDALESISRQLGISIMADEKLVGKVATYMEEHGKAPDKEDFYALKRLDAAYRFADGVHSKTVSQKPSADSDIRVAVHTVDSIQKNPALKPHLHELSDLAGASHDSVLQNDVLIENVDQRRIITVHRKNENGQYELVSAYGGDLHIDMAKDESGSIKYKDGDATSARIDITRAYNAQVGNTEYLGGKSGLSLPLRHLSEADNGGYFTPDEKDAKNFLNKVEQMNITQRVPENILNEAMIAGVRREPESLPLAAKQAGSNVLAV